MVTFSGNQQFVQFLDFPETNWQERSEPDRPRPFRNFWSNGKRRLMLSGHFYNHNTESRTIHTVSLISCESFGIFARVSINLLKIA